MADAQGRHHSFQVYVDQPDGPIIWPARDRRTPTGEPIEVVRLEMRASCRYGYTADDRQINFVGVATKCWVIAGPPTDPSAQQN